MAVGTGFGQVFRGVGELPTWITLIVIDRLCVGQVGGVAISSALFQYNLDRELRSRILGDDAAEVSIYVLRSPSRCYALSLVQIVNKIRHSATLVGKLPPDLQRIARDSYAISLRAVFTLAACSTLLAYIVRLPVCLRLSLFRFQLRVLRIDS